MLDAQPLLYLLYFRSSDKLTVGRPFGEGKKGGEP